MWARISSGVKPLIDSPVKGMYTIRLISLQDVSDHLRLNMNQRRLSKIFFLQNSGTNQSQIKHTQWACSGLSKTRCGSLHLVVGKLHALSARV